MTQTNIFGEYVEDRLSGWGREFALHRDCEYLGHQSKNMLQVLIEHKGEMPSRPTGFKPLECCPLALQVEFIVTELASPYGAGKADAAKVLRAWYAGRGRVSYERLETACELIGRKISRAQYRTLHAIGFAHVEGALLAMSRKR
jgi:hypothetical protein